METIGNTTVCLSAYLLTIRGQNTPFSTFAVPETENHDSVMAAIVEAIRFDREANVSNAFGTHLNPTLPAKTFYLNDDRQFQKVTMYQHLPADVGNHQVVDAFMCYGSRFGLTPILVYVELHQSGWRYWVEIFYGCEADIPAAIIDVHRIPLDFTQTQVEVALQKAYEFDERTASRMAELEAEFGSEEVDHKN